MNVDLIATIAEVASAGAVLVSILYLAVQVRDNTRSVKANAGFEAAHSWAATNDLLFQAPKEDLAILTRAFDPLASLEKFSEMDRVTVSVFMRSVFQKLEGQYYLYKYGSVDEIIWNNRKRWAAGVIRTPFFAHWWGVEKSQLIYTTEFVDLIESASPVAIGGFVEEAKNGAT